MIDVRAYAQWLIEAPNQPPEDRSKEQEPKSQSRGWHPQGFLDQDSNVPMDWKTFLTGRKKTARKYELLQDDTVTENGQILYRIRALKDFGPIKKGDLGGYIASERNLSHKGDCWVFGNARVCDRAHVRGDAHVGGQAVVSQQSDVSGSALVQSEAKITGKASVGEYALVAGKAKIGGRAKVEGKAKIFGKTRIYGATVIHGRVDSDTAL